MTLRELIAEFRKGTTVRVMSEEYGAPATARHAEWLSTLSDTRLIAGSEQVRRELRRRDALLQRAARAEQVK